MTRGIRVPIDQPHYGIGPAGMVRFLRKYATFRGRASLSEFWWAQLTLAIATTVLLAPGLVVYVIGAVEVTLWSPESSASMPPGFETLLRGIGLMALGGVLSWALAVPALALSWRRLQDAGLHGALSFAFVLGGGALGAVIPLAALGALVPGFLPSSLRGARFEESQTPSLPPGVDAAAWHATRAWSLGVLAPWQQQRWAAHWEPQQQWPQQQQQPWAPGPHEPPQPSRGR